ncbi:hypothetical protein [Streptomyces sp. NPDC002845]
MISEPSAALGRVYRWTDHTINPTGEARAVLRRVLRDVGLYGDIISDDVLAGLGARGERTRARVRSVRDAPSLGHGAVHLRDPRR